jgi:hypothetical protein
MTMDDFQDVEMDDEPVVSAGQPTCAEVTYTNEVTQVPTVRNYGRFRRPVTGVREDYEYLRDLYMSNPLVQNSVVQRS